MLESAVDLLRRYGVAGTSIDRVLSDSGAPRGSVYHHFPEGRAQLIREAVELASDQMLAAIDAALSERDPLQAVDRFFAVWRQQLVDTDFRAGCPVVAVTVDAAADSADQAAATGAVFLAWTSAFSAFFGRHGIDRVASDELALLVLSAEEGAVVLSRAMRSIAPLDAAAAHVRSAVTRAIEATVPAQASV